MSDKLPAQAVAPGWLGNEMRQEDAVQGGSRKTLSGEGRQRLSKLSTKFQDWCCVDDVMADPTPQKTG